MTEYTEAQLTDCIIKRWNFNGSNREVVAVQVNNAAGFSYSRTIDAVVMDTWPSSGLTLHGLEIKTSRQDLRRELQNLDKFRESAWALDFFSIVAAPGVATLEMLPDRWGLYIPDGDGSLRTRRKPLELNEERSDDVPRHFMAAYVRSLISRSLSDEQAEIARKRGHEQGVKSMQHKVDRAERKRDETIRRIKAFEEKAGFNIDSWKAGEMGEAVHLILNGGIEKSIKYARNVRDLGERLLQLADELDQLKEELSDDE